MFCHEYFIPRILCYLYFPVFERDAVPKLHSKQMGFEYQNL